MVHSKIGNLFDSQMQTLVNTVNCVGVMGKGIASVFKKQYPDMFKDYQNRCARKEVLLGKPYLYTDLSGVSIVNFPTKDHWRASSRLHDIEEGLDYFLAHYQKWNIRSIAFPPLGCGNGGLEWATVGPLMYQKLKLLNIPIEIYAPYGTPKQQTSLAFFDKPQQTEFLTTGKQRERLRPAWVALTEVLYQLEKQPYSYPVGRTIFQKICYILTKLGLDTGFQFEQNSYGPFANEVKDAISILANNNWLTETQLGKMTALRIGPEYASSRRAFMSVIDLYAKKINKTVDLFSRIKNTDQAEEIATVIYTVQKLKTEHPQNEVSEQDVFDYILEWKKSWSKQPSKQDHIIETIRSLEMLDWIRLRYSDSLPVVA